MKSITIQKDSIDKLLLISLPGMGDTLMFTPAIKVVRQNFPQAQIAVLVMLKGAQEILENNPYINEVHYWNFLQQGFWKSIFFLLKLRKKKYQLTLISYPSNRMEYNVVNFLIGARWRPTHNYNHLNTRCGGFLNHHVLKEDDTKHCVMENLLLLEKIGLDITPVPDKLNIFLSEKDRQAAERSFTKHDLHGTTVIGFHPGCNVLKNHSKRRWPPEMFAQLGGLLKEKQGAEVLIFGGPDEDELKKTVLSTMNPPGIIMNCGSVRETAAHMERCSLFVTNDSLLMHTAAALQLPTVTLYGPLNPVWDGPYGTRHKTVSKNLDCSPCFYYSPRPLTCYAQRNYECMTSISVHEVYEACAELLENENT